MSALSSTTGKHQLSAEETTLQNSSKRARTGPVSCDPRLSQIYEMILRSNRGSLEASPTLLSSHSVTRSEGERKEREVKERETKVAASLPSTTTPVDLMPFRELLKDVEREVCAAPVNQAIFRRIYRVAIQGNQVELIDLLHSYCPISSLEDTVLESVEESEVERAELEKSLKGAHLETIKKIVSLGFLFREIGRSVKIECCFKAIKGSDARGLLDLMEQLNLKYDVRAPQGTILNTLLFENLKMAEEVFTSRSFPLPAKERGERHPFFEALQRKRKDVAKFIASKLPLNEPGEPRRHFLKTLLSYVRDNNIEVIRFCLECGIRLDTSLVDNARATSLKLFFEKGPHLLAHALMEGHEELASLLCKDLNPEKLTLNLLACLELALGKNTPYHMERLKVATQRLLDLGANINLSLATDKDSIYFSPMGRMVEALLSLDRTIGQDEKCTRVMEYILFLVRKGADPAINKFKSYSRPGWSALAELDSLRLTLKNVTFIKELVEAVPEKDAAQVLMRMFLRLVYDPSSPERLSPIPEHFTPLFLRLLSIVFREFPSYDEAYINIVCSSVEANLSTVMEPMFEGETLLFYALRNATLAIKMGKITPGLREWMKRLLSTSAEINVFKATSKTDPMMSLYRYYAFHYNAVTTSLIHILPPKLPCLPPRCSDGADDRFYLRLLLEIDRVENQARLLLGQKPKFLKKNLDVLCEQLSGGNSALQAKLKDIKLLLTYAINHVYDTAKFLHDLSEKEKKEIEAICFEEQLGLMLESVHSDALAHVERSKVPGSEKQLARFEQRLKEIEAYRNIVREKICKRLKEKPAEQGTPRGEIDGVRNPELDAFYNEVIFNLKHYIYKTFKEVACFSVAERVHEYYQRLGDLVRIFEACGAQWEGGLRVLCEGSMTLRDFSSALHSDLAKIRLGMFKHAFSLYPLTPGNEVHYFNHVVTVCRSECGLPVKEKTFESENTYMNRETKAKLIDYLKYRASVDYNVVFVFKRLMTLLSRGNSEKVFDVDIAQRTVVETLLNKTAWQQEEYKLRAAQLLKEARESCLKPDFEAAWKELKSSAEEEGKICFDLESQKARFNEIRSGYFAAKEAIEKAIKDEEKLKEELDKNDLSLQIKLKEAIDDVMNMSRTNNYYFEVFDEEGRVKPAMALAYLQAEGLILPSDRFFKT